MFNNNFGKCGPLFKTHQLIRKKILYVYATCHNDYHLTCSMLLYYLVNFQTQCV